MILSKKGAGGGSLIALRFFGFTFLRMFLLVKDIHTFYISLRNELLYSYVFIEYMRGFTPLSVPRSLH